MAQYSITSGQDPALVVNLSKGETILAESDAMLCMDSSLELTGTARGGVMASLGRMMLNDESFFQQQIVAKNDGRVILAPVLPGGIAFMEIDGNRRVLMNDGAFLACDSGVTVANVTQSLGRAFFGGTGGFFIMEASGRGVLAVAGFGSVIEYDILPGKDVLIDNYHVVAWDSHLKYEVSVGTAKKGLLSGMVNSVTSGEGVVNKFYSANGQPGKVYISTRNRSNFTSWIATKVVRR